MGLHEWFNLGEGILWIAIGTALLIGGAITRANRPLKTASGLSFILFGVSDFIEMQTGSWWKPAWLLRFKALCVISLATCWWVHVLSKRRR
jgi:hypothetical protein